MRLIFRRGFRRNPTPQQIALERAARAQFRLDVVTSGLAEVLRRRSMDSHDLKWVREMLTDDIEPAIRLVKRTQADLDGSYSKRPKPVPGRALKTKRAARKPTEAKKK